MKNEKKAADPMKEPEAAPKRRIVIETDGNNINLVENQTAGVLELTAVLQTILTKIINNK